MAPMTEAPNLRLTKAVTIIGMGNPLMSDEGIGVFLAAELQSRELGENVEILDLGTSGMSVLHYIGGRKKVLFIDCAEMGERPGTLRRFTPEEVISNKVQPRLSLHEGDLIHTLSLARRLDLYPEEVLLFGIQPDRVEPGESLTPVLANRIEEYLGAIEQEINDSCQPEPVAYA